MRVFRVAKIASMSLSVRLHSRQPANNVHLKLPLRSVLRTTKSLFLQQAFSFIRVSSVFHLCSIRGLICSPSDPCHPRSSAAPPLSLSCHSCISWFPSFPAAFTCGLILSIVSLLTAGCTTPLNWETLKGPGFPGYNDQTTARTRPGTPTPKPSGHFTDRRSEQIEQNLGGF